ncbi:m142 protein [Murid betaherpesvirus 1]|nr:m142 protein [Murid betaherpesvirus 1]
MDALCAAIRSDHFRDQRPVGIRPRSRYLTAAAVTAVLQDFADIFLAQNDHTSVENVVRKESGRLLSLGAPTGWYLCLRSADQVESFPGYPVWETYGGAPAGRYTLLGQVVRRFRGVVPTEELRWFVYLGPQGQLLCHQERTDAVFVMSLSIDELARRGLVNFEPLYAERHLPLTTAVPVKLVAEFSALDPRDGTAVAERALMCQGRTILLHTPGEGDRPLVLCGTDECLRRWWPFCRMSDGEFAKFTDRVTRNLKTSHWKHFGVVGLRVGQDPFRVESVLSVIGNGAIFHTDPDMDVTWRIADNVDELFRMGLTKLYLPKRRLDRGTMGRARLEAPGCAHVAAAAWEETYVIFGCRIVRDFASQLGWLMREGRFDESSGTWDEMDDAMRKTFDAESKELVRRDVEVADALNDVDATFRGCPRNPRSADANADDDD